MRMHLLERYLDASKWRDEGMMRDMIIGKMSEGLVSLLSD